MSNSLTLASLSATDFDSLNIFYVLNLCNYKFYINCKYSEKYKLHYCNTNICKKKLFIKDFHIYGLNKILSNGDALIDDSEKNPDLWIQLETLNSDIDKIKLLYDNKSYFLSYYYYFGKYAHIFENFDLVLHYPHVVEKARSYIKEKNICLSCGKKMNHLQTDVTTTMFHPLCHNEIYYSLD